MEGGSASVLKKLERSVPRQGKFRLQFFLCIYITLFSIVCWKPVCSGFCVVPHIYLSMACCLLCCTCNRYDMRNTELFFFNLLKSLSDANQVWLRTGGENWGGGEAREGCWFWQCFSNPNSNHTIYWTLCNSGGLVYLINCISTAFNNVWPIYILSIITCFFPNSCWTNPVGSDQYRPERLCVVQQLLIGMSPFQHLLFKWLTSQTGEHRCSFLVLLCVWIFPFSLWELACNRLI